MQISPTSSPINQYYKASARPISESTPTKKEHTDTVSISSEGKFLQAQASMESEVKGKLDLLDDFMDGAGRDGVITFDEIQSFYQKSLDETKQLLKDTLKDLGYPENTSVKIESDKQGQIIITSDLPKKDNKILTEALNANDKFINSYGAASFTRQLIKDIEEYTEFAKEYEKDPKAAIIKYDIRSKDSSENEPEFFFQYSQGNADFKEKLKLRATV